MSNQLYKQLFFSKIQTSHILIKNIKINQKLVILKKYTCKNDLEHYICVYKIQQIKG
jgi:hypothetical protein